MNFSKRCVCNYRSHQALLNHAQNATNPQRVAAFAVCNFRHISNFKIFFPKTTMPVFAAGLWLDWQLSLTLYLNSCLQSSNNRSMGGQLPLSSKKNKIKAQNTDSVWMHWKTPRERMEKLALSSQLVNRMWAELAGVRTSLKIKENNLPVL